ALHHVQRRAERRGALQERQLDQARHGVAGARRGAGVVRLPRCEEDDARQPHGLSRPGRADAPRPEGQAPAVLGRPVRQARFAHHRRAAARRARLLGFLGKEITVVLAANFIAVAARMSLVTFLGIYFVREARIAFATVGVAFLCENLLRGLLAPMFGALSDRVGRRPLLLGASLTTAAVLPCFLLVEGPLSLFAWSLAMGLASAVSMPVGSALLLDLAPAERRQSVLAVNYTVVSLAYTLAVTPAGYVAEQGYVLLAALSAGTYLLVPAFYFFGLRDPLPFERSSSEGFYRDLGSVFRDRVLLGFAAMAFVFPFSMG